MKDRKESDSDGIIFDLSCDFGGAYYGSHTVYWNRQWGVHCGVCRYHSMYHDDLMDHETLNEKEKVRPAMALLFAFAKNTTSIMRRNR